MVTITGLGPGDLDRIPSSVVDRLLDPTQAVIVRTLRHPAAQQLASQRPVLSCDDLYESGKTFEDVYEAVVGRVVEAAASGPVIYAVPGSPMVGEFAVRMLRERYPGAELIPTQSFVDAILDLVGCDPLDRGLQILNGHDLPDPLALDKPTIIGHLDTPAALADVCAAIARVLPEGATVTLARNIGSSDALLSPMSPHEVDPEAAGDRTSLFIDVEPGGLIGAVHTMRLLREECPWDRDQTHQSLVKNLVEETYELVDAVGRLDQLDVEPDWVAYSEMEDELGDVLLQVLFHSVIARQAGAFDIDDVAEAMRRKLVRRHPHVFGDVAVASAAEVKENWDRIKMEERDGDDDSSVLAGVPTGMPALSRASKIQNRAAKVGFDWENAHQVLSKVREELDELSEAMSSSGDVDSELGDVLLVVVNLARHLGLDAELSLRKATNRFEERFRDMEAMGPLDGLDLEGLNERWDRAKGLH